MSRRYRTPGGRRAAVKEASDLLRASRRAVLTTHINADGDGAGSQAAVAAWLRALGARVAIVNPTSFPDMFRFLLDDESVLLEAGSSAAREACASADLAVVLDTGEKSRIGRVKPLIDGVKTLVVDHHPPGDHPIGGISLRDAEACATGELVWDVMLEAGGPWPEAALRGIYVAILTDTGSFRFSNSTPAAHRIAADLVEDGVDPEALHRRVYGSQSLVHFRLLAAALETLEVDEDARLAWMRIPREAHDALGAQGDDLEGIVDVPRAVKDVEVGLLFRQTADGSTKISFRSNGPVDVNALARKFGGGGHVKASGALVDRPPDEVVPEVVEATREAVRRTLENER